LKDGGFVAIALLGWLSGVLFREELALSLSKASMYTPGSIDADRELRRSFVGQSAPFSG
jgi:hypothetical protein